MTGSSRLDRADLLSSYPHVAPIALSMHAHERIALHRTDEAWLQRAWADPTTRVLLLDGGRLLVPDDDDQPAAQVTWVAPADAPEGVRVLLGQDPGSGSVRFAVLVEGVPAGMRGEPPRQRIRAREPGLPKELLDDERVVRVVGPPELVGGGTLEPRGAP